jgi:hypothetical protein
MPLYRAVTGTCSGTWFLYDSAEYILINNNASNLTSANAYCQSTYGAVGIASNVSTLALASQAEERFLNMVLNSSNVNVQRWCIRREYSHNLLVLVVH